MSTDIFHLGRASLSGNAIDCHMISLTALTVAPSHESGKEMLHGIWDLL
ncbi:MAG: hypothetical protein ACE5QW_00920 [Thermoplasmata archaeon]